MKGLMMADVINDLITVAYVALGALAAVAVTCLIHYSCKCKHEWDCKEISCDGVCMSWGFRPTKSFVYHYKCSKCNKTKTEGGYMFGHKDIYPEEYNADGWPIDENGDKLPIAD